MMSPSRLFQTSAVAAVVSSVFSIVAAPVAVAGTLVPVLPDLILMALLLVTDLLIFIALIGLYGAQAEESGTAGLSGFVLAEVGLAVTLLVAPLGYLLFLVGLLAFAAASSRAGVLPAGAMWLWFAGALISVPAGFLGLGILLAVGLSISAGSRAWVGMALWSRSLPSVGGRSLAGPAQPNQ